MILVTGASGLLGANLACDAHAAGRKVVGICHEHALQIPGMRVHSLDLRNQLAVRELVTRLRPASIIHCAAATNVDWCESHPSETEEINGKVPAHLAEMASQIGATLIHVSTDAVFDGETGHYAELQAANPINIYGRSKLAAEQEVLRLCPTALVVRVNIYGWNAQNKFSLAEWVLNLLAQDKQVPGFTDVHFSPILVNDLAEMLLAMLDLGLTGLYHVAGSEKISKYEFARKLAHTFKYDSTQVIPATSRAAGLRAPRPPDISLNTDKASQALGRPMPDVASGLRRFRKLQENGYPQKLKSYIRGAQ